MVSPQDAVAAIQGALPNINAAHLANLATSTGYVYQAYVMVAIGDHTTQTVYDWWHPANGPTFSKAHGLALRDVQARLSRLESKPRHHRRPRLGVQNCRCANNGGRANAPRDVTVIQSVRWSGRGGLEHALDIAVLCHGNLEAVVECKNWDGTPGIATARELVGLWADVRPPYARLLRQGLPHRLGLVSATGASQPADTFLRHYAGRVLTLDAPYNPIGQPHWPFVAATCQLCGLVLA